MVLLEAPFTEEKIRSLKVGDMVEIATPRLGRLVNRVMRTDQCPEWTFGTRALMRNLVARGLADKV